MDSPKNNKRDHTSIYKKGTIPYYFKKIGAVTEALQTNENQNTDFFRS